VPHPVSPKLPIVEKIYKDKRYYTRRDNPGKIVDFVSMGMGFGSRKFISPLLPP
jgi:hypothetical protein